jgi:hypothetical protein
MVVVEIRVEDEFHIFKLLNVIDLVLYTLICLKPDDWLSRIPFAFNLGLMLEWALQTYIGENGWPRGWYTNYVILGMFTLYFYFSITKLWSFIFLLIGMLFIDPIWGGIQADIVSALYRLFGYTMEETGRGVIFVFVLFVLATVVLVAALSRSTSITLLVAAVTCSTKAMTAVKGLFYCRGTIQCTGVDDSSLCPFWFNRQEWLYVLTLCAARLGLVYVWRRSSAKVCCFKSDQYKLLPSEEPEAEPADERPSVQPPRTRTPEVQLSSPARSTPPRLLSTSTTPGFVRSTTRRR